MSTENYVILIEKWFSCIEQKPMGQATNWVRAFMSPTFLNVRIQRLENYCLLTATAYWTAAALFATGGAASQKPKAFRNKENPYVCPVYTVNPEKWLSPSGIHKIWLPACGDTDTAKFKANCRDIMTQVFEGPPQVPTDKIIRFSSRALLSASFSPQFKLRHSW